MHIRLHGPTYFAPLINQTVAIASSLNDPRKQKYFVLMIVTDGAIMDMPATLDAIVRASHTVPLSVRYVVWRRPTFRRTTTDGVLCRV
jgi:hypothetical protein